jgi:hypothetical protein
MAEFISDTVFKRDVFSETRAGHFADHPDIRVARRIVTASPLWSRPFAWFLAKREIKALRAVAGISGTPEIIEIDADGLFRIMAYEDLRHCIKQKRAFAPQLMTATEIRILARKSLPSRIWMATGKKLYNLITRGLFSWSDGEGTGDRIDREGPAIVKALQADPGIGSVALSLFPLPRKGVGIYAFVETDARELNLDRLNHRVARLDKNAHIDLVQPVASLPRQAGGAVRDDVLSLIAMNQITELDDLIGREPELGPIVRPIMEARLNWTDRRISRLER